MNRVFHNTDVMAADWQFLCALKEGDDVLDFGCSREGKTADELKTIGCKVCVAPKEQLLNLSDWEPDFTGKLFAAVIIFKADLPAALKCSLKKTKAAIQQAMRFLAPAGKLIIISRDAPAPIRYLRRLIHFPFIPVECSYYDRYLLEGFNLNRVERFHFYPGFENFIYVFPAEGRRVIGPLLRFLFKNFREYSGGRRYLGEMLLNFRIKFSQLFYDYCFVGERTDV